MARVTDLPFLVILMGIGALAMLVPVPVALVDNDHEAARAFFYGALLFGMLTTLIGIATVNNAVKNQARSHLLAMLGCYTALPLMLAVPLTEAVPDLRLIDAYFEMVSCLTTTGATIFDGSADPGPAVHLWRALVGWLGGYFLWVTAIAILAPMNLGGFEVTATQGGVTGRARPAAGATTTADARERLIRFGAQLAPVYLGLTASLWVLMLLTGEGPLVAACHAMAVMATSGISPVGGVEGGASGLWGEFMLFWFFAFAFSRRTFMFDFRPESWRGLVGDLEFRMGIAIAWLVTAFLIARHWMGAYGGSVDENGIAALKALWGAVFTVTSFLTTTGFTSGEWAAARDWSGLPSPGLILVGLAVFGGGVATTAGGVKLLRIYALYKHGVREMEKLIHPSSVGGAGAYARRIRRQGAQIAFVFFMLFALSVAVVMVALGLTGLDFEAAMVLTVAALTTTGPLAGAAADPALSYAALGDDARMVLAAAMVLGRLETLAIIALMNPEFWRS
ncbi:TrkH family potassium uptake protein [Rhodovulum adriaticum]|uniref:Trk system potassium uptake protein TrkH n=1 Tax=Rhodovulum adriaticum TaxID=35804 RepID=A0A4R2NTI0_RHOAD|nr:potassium transporter TrkG [Rhodovulum adriaticum]MBK1635053.1 potassium transporter TrkH [Rhodovulum adriaticum]TCP25313.1 trk system potassium uptake protein TrkH [Rhodovulum adriaticum]